jgi:hypothetical protein
MNNEIWKIFGTFYGPEFDDENIFVTGRLGEG